MRHLLGVLGGVLLALLLFTLLALLVAPPKDDQLVIEMPKSLSMIEAVDVQASEQASSAVDTPPPQATTPPPPPPVPLPSPLVESDISLPEPELPPLERPEMPEQMALPELAAIEPTPEPEPQPQPEPQPEPVPQEPEPSPSDSLADNSAQPSESPAATSAEAGSPEPTRRVPPQYPSRAQRRGLEGYVEVRFTIRPDGSVDSGSLQVIEAQPRNVFERAAMKAVARWEFPEAEGLREARQRLEFKLEG